ncbi:FtsK/SpoIIIE domain-containing protein [Lacticaseibacillus paracasei]|uniref:FtsK/SpoIIIE domain-containing protein n=1 Tax=Lacticaseibacillus paracasei TaxID=1597 RepID=UPI0018995355|nr:FtsK/SpoIIIE domain-containing protein [Lacticaseibacillus paracasei]
MVTMIEWLSRLLPTSKGVAVLTINDSIVNTDKRRRRAIKGLFKLWTGVCIILEVGRVSQKIVTRTFESLISISKTSFAVYSSGIMLAVFTVLAWRYFHSEYSPLERWQLELLLRRFSETTDLLGRPDNEVKQTQSIRWEYQVMKHKTIVKLFTGGHVSLENEHDIGRRLLAFLSKETTRHWEMITVEYDTGKVQLHFTHESEQRIIVDRLNVMPRSESLNIPLSSRFSWTDRQPMGLIVGPTGSGKTSLLKSIIIGFLANAQNNEVYTIDGKAAFLSFAMSRIGKVATDGEGAIRLTEELCEVMKNRYSEMNADYDSEKDQVYVEMFHQGTILLVADELLSLVATMQAEDKEVKPADRLYPKLYKNLLSLIVKGRQASISVIISGQMMPASILPTEARSSLGMRISLGRTSPQQAQEVFGVSNRELPSVDAEHYGGLIWLDGLNWDGPKAFLPPMYDDKALPFKATLTKLAASRGGGGTPQDAGGGEHLPVT